MSRNTNHAESIRKWSKPALERIAQIRSESEAVNRACWHFSGVAQEGDFDGFDEEYHSSVVSRASLNFSDMELVYGGLGSFELWEAVTPDFAWLDARLPEMANFADALGVRLDGWSFEPIGRLPSGEIPQAFSSFDDEIRHPDAQTH